MWRLSSGSGSGVSLVAIVILAMWLSKQCQAFHAAAADYSADYENDFSQLNARLRDTLRYIEKLKSHPSATGLRPRAARNDVVGETDHALRMHQLHELNRMFGAKARPRFGKRAEVALVPTYGFDDNVYRVLGSSEERR